MECWVVDKCVCGHIRLKHNTPETRELGMPLMNAGGGNCREAECVVISEKGVTVKCLVFKLSLVLDVKTEDWRLPTQEEIALETRYDD